MLRPRSVSAMRWHVEKTNELQRPPLPLPTPTTLAGRVASSYWARQEGDKPAISQLTLGYERAKPILPQARSAWLSGSIGLARL